MATYKKNKYRSIVDEYDKYYNSFDRYLKGYDKSDLYPFIVNRNFDNEIVFPISTDDKIRFNNDCLESKFKISSLGTLRGKEYEIPSSYFNMFMKSCNPFYYTYSSAEEDVLIRIYSKQGLQILIDFVNNCSDFPFEIIPDNIQGYVDIVDIQLEGCRTRYNNRTAKKYYANAFLFKECMNLKFDNLKIQLDADVESACSLFKIKNLRLFILALMKQILSAIGENTNGMSLNDYLIIITNKSLFHNFLSKIEVHYESFSDEIKNGCVFFSEKYKYVYSRDRINAYLDAKICALANEVTHHFDYEILNFSLFKKHHWKNNIFDKFVISTMTSLCENKDKVRWYNHTDSLRMQYLKSLLFLNWCYTPHKVAKSATAIWLYYILNRNLINSFSRDKVFYKTLIAYVLQKNNLTFIRIVNEIKSKYAINSENIYLSLIAYFSDGFDFSISNYIFNQKKLLSRNLKKSLSWDELRLKFSNDNELVIAVKQGKEWAERLYLYVAQILEAPDYTNKKIVDLVDDMPDYPIPYPYS